MIGVAIGVGVLLLIILIIILTTIGQKKDNDDIIGKDMLGEIECVYDISSKTEPTNLLGEEFQKNFLLSIEVNGV